MELLVHKFAVSIKARKREEFDWIEDGYLMMTFFAKCNDIWVRCPNTVKLGLEKKKLIAKEEKLVERYGQNIFVGAFLGKSKSNI